MATHTTSMKAAAVTAKHYERLEMMILRRSAQGIGTESKSSMSQAASEEPVVGAFVKSVLESDVFPLTKTRCHGASRRVSIG